MDSKKIRAYLTVVEHGSITAAADLLGYTQPGLTNMMNSLEAELGLNLLLRSKTGVTPTRDAWELMPSFKRFIASDDEIVSYATRLVEKNSSTLRVGAFSSAARSWLPVMLAKFRQQNIGTDTAVTATNVLDTYEAVKEGNLDCAIVSKQETYMKGLAWIPLHSDELMAVLPKEYVTDDEQFSIEFFNEEDFLMPAGGFDLDILPALAADGNELKANVQYSNLDDGAIASMVSHCLGFSVLSRLVLEGIHEDVQVLPLRPRAWREMGIITLEDRLNDKNISRFIQVAQSTVESMYGSGKTE